MCCSVCICSRARKMRSKESKKMLPIRKMTEKFSRDVSIDADADVAKRVYYLAENRIRVDYHFGENRVTQSSRMFHKDGQSQIIQVGVCGSGQQRDAGAQHL